MECINNQDSEWAEDWKIIVRIFDTIEQFERLFTQLDVPYLRKVHQKVLLSNLKRYAWSLQNYIIEKYSKQKT